MCPRGRGTIYHIQYIYIYIKRGLNMAKQIRCCQLFLQLVRSDTLFELRCNSSQFTSSEGLSWRRQLCFSSPLWYGLTVFIFECTHSLSGTCCIVHHTLTYDIHVPPSICRGSARVASWFTTSTRSCSHMQNKGSHERCPGIGG